MSVFTFGKEAVRTWKAQGRKWDKSPWSQYHRGYFDHAGSTYQILCEKKENGWSAAVNRVNGVRLNVRYFSSPQKTRNQALEAAMELYHLEYVTMKGKG